MTQALFQRTDAIRAAAEAALASALDALSAAPPALVAAMRYSLLSRGKLLRPVLAVLSCEAGGGTLERALPAACAVEMVHTYSLIHDDLPAMDDDDLRRGRPTCHVRFGEALAILAGDALLTLAFETLASGYPARTAAVATMELARGAGPAGMVGGQVLDLAAEGRLDAGAGELPRTADDLERIHRAKTGALLRASVRMGLAAAQAERPEGIDPGDLERLDVFGRAFGLAFQITDDLLDVQGTDAAAGKRVGKDAGRGKLTYPGLLGVPESRLRAEALCRRAADAVSSMGDAGRTLADLAAYLLERDR